MNMSYTHTYSPPRLHLADLISDGLPELNAQYGAVLNDAQRHALRALHTANLFLIQIVGSSQLDCRAAPRIATELLCWSGVRTTPQCNRSICAVISDLTKAAETDAPSLLVGVVDVHWIEEATRAPFGCAVARTLCAL